MERQMIFLLSGVSLLVVVITLGVLFFYGNESTIDQPVYSAQECNVLYDHGGETNIVFISNEETAKRYIDFLFSIPPFNENKESFNVFYIDSDIADKECETYKGIALLCYSKELVKEASICPSDYIVVLKKMPKSIRSSAFMNVMSLNTAHTLSVFAHEFGHAYANFAEEYLTESKVPSGSKNCQKECEKFEDLEDGCFEGCTKPKYYRSIFNGVMKTLKSEDYGNFNENLIRERIIEEKEKQGKDASSVVTSLVVDEAKVDCNDEQHRLVEAKYVFKDGIYKLEVVSDTLEYGCVGSEGHGGTKLEYTEGGAGMISKINPIYIYTDSVDEADGLSGQTYDNTIEPDSKPIIVRLDIPRDKDEKTKIEITAEVEDPADLERPKLLTAEAELKEVRDMVPEPRPLVTLEKKPVEGLKKVAVDTRKTIEEVLNIESEEPLESENNEFLEIKATGLHILNTNNDVQYVQRFVYPVLTGVFIGLIIGTIIFKKRFTKRD